MKNVIVCVTNVLVRHSNKADDESDSYSSDKFEDDELKKVMTGQKVSKNHVEHLGLQVHA